MIIRYVCINYGYGYLNTKNSWYLSIPRSRRIDISHGSTRQSADGVRVGGGPTGPNGCVHEAHVQMKLRNLQGRGGGEGNDAQLLNPQNPKPYAQVQLNHARCTHMQTTLRESEGLNVESASIVLLKILK